MGIKLVKAREDKTTLIVEDTDYELTPGLKGLTQNERPRATQYNASDLEEYGNLVRQTEVKSFPNQESSHASSPQNTWKFDNILWDIPEDADDTDSVESDTASIGDTETSDIDIASPDPGSASPASTRRPSSSPFWPPPQSPSPARTRYGKAKKVKERKHTKVMELCIFQKI